MNYGVKAAVVCYFTYELIITYMIKNVYIKKGFFADNLSEISDIQLPYANLFFIDG